MIRRRESPDGLPFRVYEYRGVRTYSIGFKRDDGTWAFRLKCPIGDAAQISVLKREALRRAADAQFGTPDDGSFAALADAWKRWQEALPDGTRGKRAESTFAENKRELLNLKRAFGTMQVSEMTKGDGYEYLDACLIARDKLGQPRPRPEKGNKEIALAHLVLEFGVRRRWLEANPFDGIEKLLTERPARLVAEHELALALEVGRRMGGPQQIVALALRTAFLCVRRSVEVRAMTRDQVTDHGIVWTAGKRRAGQPPVQILIEWSPELRRTIDEALAIKRRKLSGSWYVFGNLDGQRYTKGGWKATLSKLMAECIAEAARRRVAFAAFSLQDCRPHGTTAKLERGDRDVVDATGHTSERMVRQVYDRRRQRKAKPAG